jgi:hypothetical protein
MRFGRISFCSVIAGMIPDIARSNVFRSDIFLISPCQNDTGCCSLQCVPEGYFFDQSLPVHDLHHQSICCLSLCLLNSDVILNKETDCKPGYVSNGHLSRPAVAGRFKQPTRTDISGQLSVLFGLASDGACRAPYVTVRPVVSCTAVAPLPGRHECLSGGFLSVALSLGLLPPDVIRHPAL